MYIKIIIHVWYVYIELKIMAGCKKGVIAKPVIFSNKSLVSLAGQRECPVVRKLVGRGVGSIGRTPALGNVVTAKDFDCVMMVIPVTH